ncbi:MAG: hypothetical protein IKU79_08040 [Bacteroidaceae bacterium]|jgi:uncharacterized protein|nr:hypothetical protein [Bacteroidaceae bacterium]
MKLPPCNIERVREFAQEGWTLGETHGIYHWRRVERNAIVLATDNGVLRRDVNIKVVRYFAYLHDKWRHDDGWDLEHGPRAAEMISTIRHTILSDLTDEEVCLLQQACRYHTSKHRTGNATIDTCFDADRLDLGRVGITPDPLRMASQQGAYYANNLQLLKRIKITDNL